MIFTGSVQQKGDSYSSLVDGEEPSLYTKWWYVVRIIHWHHAEGLIIPSLIIDWVLNQLQVLIFYPYLFTFSMQQFAIYNLL